MADIQPNVSILEDGDEALIEQQQDEQGVEYTSLEADIGASTVDTAPKPVAKPATRPGAKTAVKPDAGDDADVPEEFRGKSKKELADMYRNAQSTIGRQGHELGDLRRRTDDWIKASLSAKATPPKPARAPKPIEDAEIFAQPRETITKLVAEHPTIKRMEQTLGVQAANEARRRAEDATTRFTAAHPDAGEVLQDPEFINWVQQSPIRTAMLKAAHTNFNFEAGNEVFSTWKALKGARRPAIEAAAATDAQAKANAEAARKAALKKAGVPSGGNASPNDAGGQKGKIYRRSDILRLMEESPERYAELSDEIALAYQQKRVR